MTCRTIKESKKYNRPFTALDCPYENIVEFAKTIGPKSVLRFCALVENAVKHPDRVCRMECSFRGYNVGIIAILNHADNTMLLLRDWYHIGDRAATDNQFLFCRALLNHDQIEWLIAQVVAEKLARGA